MLISFMQLYYNIYTQHNFILCLINMYLLVKSEI